MGDLISRQGLIDRCDDIIENGVPTDSGLHLITVETVKSVVETMPSAQQEKVCIATITLSEEQLHEMCEKAKNEIVQMLPSAQQWIPCSERLPKIEQDVLIWTKDNTYEIAHLDIMEWTEDELVWYPQYNRLGDEVEWEIEEVIAWMPLPEPWKGDSNEQIH